MATRPSSSSSTGTTIHHVPQTLLLLLHMVPDSAMSIIDLPVQRRLLEATRRLKILRGGVTTPRLQLSS